ncbi:phage antirepressor [Planococcus rifietoensis]|uniref:phage antirepressor n=1 Tax=Planococcus rifietoensis TaxID=200991 RepID=UPI0038514E9E
MNELQNVFNFEGNQVRTVRSGQEIFFVAKDVCEVFGDTNYRRSLSRLDEDEKGVSPLNTPGGAQKVSVVNEAGLFTLLFNMQPQKKANMTDEQYDNRVASLKKFKRWVTHEVLPSIRKHGAYMTPDTLQQAILNPDFAIGLLTNLKDEQEKRREAELQIETQKPKVLFAESVETSKTSILIRELAVLLKQNGIDTGERRLYTWLRENGYLVRRHGSDRNMPTQRSMNLGLFEVKETPIHHNSGDIKVGKTTKVTGKGQVYFINKFLSERLAI